MSEISPRPWEIVDFDGWDVIFDANKNEVTDQFDEYFVSIENVEHIVKCVNEHDSLVAEVERLQQENEQLREALRKCSFLAPKDGNACYCIFCDEKFTHLKYTHKDDCEYEHLAK